MSDVPASSASVVPPLNLQLASQAQSSAYALSGGNVRFGEFNIGSDSTLKTITIIGGVLLAVWVWKR